MVTSMATSPMLKLIGFRWAFLSQTPAARPVSETSSRSLESCVSGRGPEKSCRLFAFSYAKHLGDPSETRTAWAEMFWSLNSLAAGRANTLNRCTRQLVLRGRTKILKLYPTGARDDTGVERKKTMTTTKISLVFGATDLGTARIGD